MYLNVLFPLVWLLIFLDEMIISSAVLFLPICAGHK